MAVARFDRNARRLQVILPISGITMDRLDELATFLAIIDAGSLAAAARQLRRSPPAVTRSLTALEDRLGVRLLERTTRRLAATEAGRQLATRARAVLAAYGEAMRDAETDTIPRGTLRVTAPVVFGRKHVTPIVTAFLADHPAVTVELMLSDGNVDLIENALDVAIRIGTQPDSSLIARRVGQVRRMLVAGPGYLRQHGTPAAPEALADHAILLTTSRPGSAEWRFRQGNRQRAVRLTPRFTVNDVEATLTAARQDHGIASALSYQVAEDLAAGTLVRLLAEWEQPPLPVQIIQTSAQHRPPRVRAFVDHAVRHLTALRVLAAP
jgi:DNA-binding transcriptional LysR family regulator